MPSPDAIMASESFAQMGKESVAYDEFSAMEGSYTPVRAPNLTGALIGRPLAATLESARILGISVDENSDVLRALRIAVMTNQAFFGFYRAVYSLRKAEATKGAALAAAETAANLNPFTWWRIPVAAGAAALVFASFETGAHVGSGDWKLPSIDISNPSDRRYAGRHMRAIGGS